MELRRLLLTAIAAAILTTAGTSMAMAAPRDRSGHHDSDRGSRSGDHRSGYRDRSGDHRSYDRDRRGDRRGDRYDRSRHSDRSWHGDRDWRGGNWRGDHDRYWRRDYGRRHYVGHDRIYRSLRRHHYSRFLGDPMWYDGRYVVRTYDRWGNLIFVEVDPYTGGFIGVIRF